MDYIPKLSKLSCIQNHDLSWIRNENARYVSKPVKWHSIWWKLWGKTSRGDGEGKKEEGSSKMPFPPPFNLAMATFKLI